MITGEISIISDDKNQTVTKNEIAILNKGNEIHVQGHDLQNRFLLVSAKPINEPVVRSGPFVMSNQTDLDRAFADFQSGILVRFRPNA